MEAHGKLNNNGTTLVELMVTFALVGIFMMSATQVISYTMNIYYQAKSVTYSQQVSNLLMKKMTSMIEGAGFGDKAEGVAMKISPNHEVIEFYDKTSSHVAITKNSEGYLVVHYYATQYSEDGDTGYDAVDWTFDRKAYMGFVIQELTFEQMGSGEYTAYSPNIIKVTLSMKSSAYGEFTMTDYVECYNFGDYGRIDGNSSSITPIETLAIP